MTEQPISIPIDLDAQDFVQGAGQIGQASDALQANFRGLTVSTSAMNKAFGAFTPGRATLGAMGAFAALAAVQQQRLSGLSATASITGVNVNKLAGSVRSMAREMPLGAKNSLAVVEQFTRMGIAAKGSEVQIGRLSKSVLQLSGATGEGPAGLAEGMTQLARATGNASLDSRRFEAIGDSLTKVSKESGASASSILAFSKNIAPMANAAGIGATGVLGISSAFARLGEDGFGASTAVNKMLTDMSRSVREGGPQMRNYAEIVGKSADEFERLFRANPTEALTQVTEAVANAGNAGPRLLEQIGVEGVRGQRSLQALSASGGLRSAVAQATAGYASGDTETAAKAAFGGLNDQMVELRETSAQLGEAMGAPLLTPLTAFSKLLQVPVAALGKIAGSGAAQGALSVAAYGAIAVMIAKAVMGPLVAMGYGRQAATSGIVRGLLGGFAETHPGGGRFTRFAQRFGAGTIAADEAGTLGPYSTRALEFGRSFGTAMGPKDLTVAGGTIADRIRGTIATGLQLQNNMTAAGLRNAAETNPLNRTPMGADAGAPWEGFWEEIKDRWGGTERKDLGGVEPGPGMPVKQRQQYDPRGMPVAPATLTDFGLGPMAGQAEKATKGFTSMSGILKSANDRLVKAGEGANLFGRSAVSAGRVAVGAAQLTGKLAADTARGGKAVAGMLGLTSPAGLAVAGVGAGVAGIMALRASNAARKQDIVERSDMDVHGTLNAYRESIGLATEATISLGSQFSQLGKQTMETTTTIAQASKVTDLDVDVARADKKKDPTARYVGSAKQVAAEIGNINVAGLGPQELAAVKLDLLKGGQSKEFVQSVMNQLPASTVAGGGGSLTGGSGANAMTTIGALGEQGREHFYSRGMKQAGKDQVDALVQATGQRYSAQSTMFGHDYAEERRARSINKEMAAVWKTGNTDLIERMTKLYSQQLTGVKGGVEVEGDSAAQRRGFVQTLMRNNEAFAKTEKGVNLTGPAMRGVLSEGIYAQGMRQAGGAEVFAGMYDQRTGRQTAGGKALAASLELPEDTKLFSQAVKLMTREAKSTGLSFMEVAQAAQKSTVTLAEGTPALAIQQAIVQKAEQGMRGDQRGMTPVAVLSQNIAYHTGKAQGDRGTEYGRQRAEEGEEQLMSDKEQMRSTLANILLARRQYMIARKRADVDFNQQQTYAEEDYLRARQRAKRNFNISIERMEQDAAKQLYNIYDRIMVQPTWDTGNLLDNSREQTEAMEKQVQTLKELRKRGVSQQTIDLMELYKPENAQQAEVTAQDLRDNPAQIARLNREAARRGRAAAALSQDPSNTDTRRMREDFSRNLSDMAKDMDRARERNSKAFERGMKRMAADFKHSQQAISGDYKSLAKQVDRSIAEQTVHWAKFMVDETAALVAEAAKIPTQLADAMNPATNPFDPAQAAQALYARGVGVDPFAPVVVPHLTKEQRGVMNTAGSTAPVHRAETHNYDNRNDFNGAQITVQAQDPDELGRKLEAKKRRANLTTTKGVKWAPS